MSDDDLGRRAYEYKVETGATWAETAKHFGETRGRTRKQARQYYEGRGLQPPQARRRIVAGLDEEPHTDPDELWKRALRIEERSNRVQESKALRRVIYDEGPVVLFLMADLHLGSAGVSYRAIDADIRTIQELDARGVQVGVLLVGDLIDNFIVGKLQALRMHTSPFLAVEEWGLCDYVLERLAPHLIGSVGGNHDAWSWAVTGVDLLRERHRELNNGILYDQHELGFILQVGDGETKVVARHRWAGSSIYNPTHPLEHHHRTRGRSFDVGIMAHTHRGALVREMDNGGRVGYAIVLGSYKKRDNFAVSLGLPPPLPTNAAALLVTENGVQVGTSNVDGLAALL